MENLPATLTAIAAIIGAIGVILAAYWAYNAKKAGMENKGEIAIVKGEIRNVGTRIDGRMDELLRAATASGRAEGVAAGEQAQRDRSGPRQDRET
jgi:hypothetical protein